MKVGFFLRQKITYFEKILRSFLLRLEYFIWLFFSPSKFARKPKTINKILVIDLGAFGDALNTLCIIDKLKKESPSKKFVYLVRKNFYEAMSNNFPSAEAIYYEENPAFYKKLRDYNFDIAIIIHLGEIKQKNLSFIRYKVGAETSGIFDFFVSQKFFISRKIFPFYQHKIKERFRIFNLAGFKFKDYNLALPSSETHKTEAALLIRELHIKDPGKLIFLNPFSAKSTRARKENKIPSSDWPFENFSKIADKILGSNKNARILITGQKEDEALAKSIIQKISLKNHVKSICGKTSFFGLGELMRTVKENSILISIDTGTAHLGASAGIPVIDLNGPHDPKIDGAWSPSDIFKDSRAISLLHPNPCSKCRRYYCPEKNPICMKSIMVQEVFEVYKKLA